MGEWTYYFSAKGYDGEDVWLRIVFHHNEIVSIDEVTQEEMQKEIEENKTETEE